MLNALSVDVEDWFQVGAFETVIAKSDWDRLPQRVERNADAVLALFDEAGVKATFFTLGWVATRYPALMRRDRPAAHGGPTPRWDPAGGCPLTPERFRADLRRAHAAIADASGVASKGDRAPRFSIDARSSW